MAKKTMKKPRPQASDIEQTKLPAGVKLLRTLVGHQDRVTSLTFQPQGDVLVSGSHDHTVRIWEPGSGKLLRTFTGHERAVRALLLMQEVRSLPPRAVTV